MIDGQLDAVGRRNEKDIPVKCHVVWCSRTNWAPAESNAMPRRVATRHSVPHRGPQSGVANSNGLVGAEPSRLVSYDTASRRAQSRPVAWRGQNE
jgi:hypothetical protein